MRTDRHFPRGMPYSAALGLLVALLALWLTGCTSIETDSTALQYTDAQGVPRECKVETVKKRETETDPAQIEALANIVRSQIAAGATGGLAMSSKPGPVGMAAQAEPLPEWCDLGEAGEPRLCLWTLDDGSCRALVVR